jgi:16S rRNA (guanine527-N7)-methyltransferase
LSLTPNLLGETLEKAGLTGLISADSLSALTHFSLKMLQINETLNLTRWTEDEAFLNYHLLDSAFALPAIKSLVKGPQRWMDLGSGCGFPGAVLIAAFSEAEVTLMDSVAKKTKALAECLDAAGWEARTLTGRAEEIGRNAQTRETWDGVTVRAVADFRIVLEYAIPLLKTGGYLVNWMTEDQFATVDKAQKAFEVLQCKIVQKSTYSLPGLNQSRFIAIVEKLGTTSPIYPRSVGLPSKKPL